MLTYRTPPVEDIGPLQEIADHVLWLSTAMIHHANRIRPNPSGLKVGGHQASCASMVSIMTSLWFGQLQRATGCRSSPMPRRCCTRSTTCWASSRGVPDDGCASSADCRAIPSRIQGSRSGRLLHGVGGNRCHGTDLGRDRAPVRRHRIRCHRHRPAVLAGRRCRTGRGRGVGGDPGPVGRRTRRDRLDRRHQPAVAGPGGAQHRAPAGSRRCSPRRAGRSSHVKFGRLLEELFTRPGGAALRTPHPGHAQPRIPTAAAMHAPDELRTGCPATAPAPTRSPA